MSRLSLSLCIVSLWMCCSFVSAQEAPEPLQSTPAVLGQIAEARQAIEKLPTEEKVTAHFRLLSLLVRFEDKTPARETIATILKLVPTIEKELTQQQLLEAVAYTQADNGDFTAALETVDRIGRVSSRANARLTIVERILGDNETTNTGKKPKDVLPILRQAISDAVEAQNAGLEAVARVLFGKELARQGKTDEARAEFTTARKKAAEIEAVEERNVVAMIVRSEVETGMIPEAMALLETIADEEMKRGITGYAAVVLVQEEKNDEANKLIDSLKADDYRDNILMGIVREMAKTISPAKIQELTGRLSNPERKEIFLQNAARVLLESDRVDAAAEIAEKLADDTQIQTELRVAQLQKLLEEKKYDEAQKLVEAFTDEQVRLAAMRYILITRFRNGASEDVQKLAEATFSDDEKQQAGQLRKEVEKVAEIADSDQRMAALSEIVQAQFSLLDLLGARKTLGLMLQNAEAMEDAARSVKYRVALSMMQTELGDSGVRENLTKTLAYLDGIKDLDKLAGLVPEDDPMEGDEPQQAALVVKGRVDKDDIQTQLFEVYLTIANVFGNADDASGAKKAFQKAKEVAENDSNEIRKTEKLLLLSQILAELETPKSVDK